MFHKYFSAIKNIIFPCICLYCETKISQGYLCLPCWEKIPFLYPPLCRHCSTPISIDASGYCRKCLSEDYACHQTISITAYREPIVSLIYLFKYKNYDYLADFLASLMAQHLSKIGFNFAEYDFMVPMPMHSHKLKERGYNQAELLTKLLSNYFKISFRNDIISALYDRPSQTKLAKVQRQKNVAGVFLAEKEAKNRKIILVDDIFTTGATARACSQALKEKSAAQITVLTLSKTFGE